MAVCPYGLSIDRFQKQITQRKLWRVEICCKTFERIFFCSVSTLAQLIIQKKKYITSIYKCDCFPKSKDLKRGSSVHFWKINSHCQLSNHSNAKRYCKISNSRKNNNLNRYTLWFWLHSLRSKWRADSEPSTFPLILHLVPQFFLNFWQHFID